MRQEEGRDGGKIEWKLSEVDTRAMSRGQNELIGKLKMAVCDVISFRRQVMKDTYIPTRIKRELVRFGMLEEDHEDLKTANLFSMESWTAVKKLF